MSASHRRSPRMRSGHSKNSALDHVLDFGPEPEPETTGASLSPEASHRLREVIRKIEEMSARIDRLVDSEDL